MHHLLFNNIVRPTKTIMDQAHNTSFLFIADISGFTRFVNETEIQHSSHIIQELLEIIIENNDGNMKIAEIEGDAVFFYKEKEVLDVSSIVENSQKIFTAFHKHLKLYERDRICQCGACSSTSSLNLKFVSHQGEVVFQEIKGSLQLMGKEVTLIHKLLKNNVPGTDYILFSNSFHFDEAFSNSFELQEESSQYEGIGNVKYNYLSLANFKNGIEIPPRATLRKYRTKNPIVKNVKINASLKKVHANLIDLSIRTDWKVKTKYDKKEIEKVGTIHECILPQGNVPGQTVDHQFKENEIILEEYLDRFKLIFPAISEVYTLTSTGKNSMNLKVEIHIHTNPISKILFNTMLNSGFKKSFKKFKEICERESEKDSIIFL